MRYARGMAALVKCAACRGEISDAAEACPKCGHPVAANQHRRYATARIVGLLLVGAVVIVVAGRWMGVW